MTLWKLPPIAKVYEALTAVADGRVTLTSETTAQVGSSDGSKTYDLNWSADGLAVSSNDNASYWQGYLGYPIIALLLVQGRVAYDPAVAQALAGVPWKALNTQFKRNYARAIEHVLADIAAKGGDRAAIEREVEAILEQLGALGLERGPRGKGPPRS